MTIEICTVGGYDEIGRNMTAVKIDDDVIIFDMGLHMENYIASTEREDVVKVSADLLMESNAVPDISKIKDWMDKVRLIIPSHAHLDHAGAIPYLANKFNCPVICTPFTAAVLETILRDEKIRLKNKILRLTTNSHYTLNKDIRIEFVSVTHSTPHTVIVAVHTRYGVIMYSNDFKLDNFPTLGKKPNYEKLKELGDKGVACLITDSTNAGKLGKTPSEATAKQMLKDILLGANLEKGLIVVTTFASHIARLKSIVELGKELNRKIYFLGRSLGKYVIAAQDVQVVDFRQDVKLDRYQRQIEKRLQKLQKTKSLLVVTGHQGEPGSVLDKIARGKLNLSFDENDSLIFSCKVIPTETNRKNREALEAVLRKTGIRIFHDVHVSGHAAREDIRDFLALVRPRNLVPAHGDLEKRSSVKSLALEMRLLPEKNIHLMNDGQRFRLA